MRAVHPRIAQVAQIALLAGVYVLAARAGLTLDAVSGFATLVWPASGIALAALLRGGFGLWPGIAIGAFAANAWTGAPVPVALGIAAGNTLEALVAAYALERVGFRLTIDRVRDVASLVAAALLSTVVSAAIGTGCLYAGDIVSTVRLGVTFRAWWLGDVIGDLIVAPLILSWITAAVGGRAPRRRWEGAALALLALGLGLLVFHDLPMPVDTLALRQAYVLFPVFIWAGLRFEQRGATLVTFAVCAIAVWGTVLGHGPFAHPVLHESLTTLQTFMSIAALTALLLGAVIAERARAEREAQHHAARVQLLADASRTYAEASHDLPRALATVARQIGDAMGATCIISLRVDGDSLETAAVYDADPEAHSLLSALADQVRPIDSLPSGAVIRTGTTLLLPQVDPGAAPASVDPRFRAYLARFAPTSLVAVPLRQRGDVFGSVVVARHAPGRTYSRDDAVLVEDLAERAALAIENARLFQRTQAAIQLRDEFLSVASHELRTPLSAVMLQLQGLRQSVDAAQDRLADSKLPARLDKVVRATERLTKLVDSLLDVSRIATQRLDLHVDECDLAEIARDTLERVAEQARSAGCQLHLSADGRVDGQWDRLRLEQVLTNLLSNAIKYGSSKPIEVSVTATFESAKLIVRDHGIGISEADVDRIFNRFERAVPVSHYGGLGLGLYIARKIVEAHGGRIVVASEPNAGAVFMIELPRELPATRSVPAPAAGGPT